ncbi:hypothetical protein C2S51_012742 [Perilla frutescens var. frutescens]|nr:hypothetical protein C2S51_012742 [Perilla frutescens var. frutescens]
MGLVSSVVGLALKPLLLAKASCQCLCVVVETCFEILRFGLSLHLLILWRLAISIMALLSLPVRAFTALYRERLVEVQLHGLKKEMENVILDCKEVEEQLHESMRDGAMMRMMLMELEKEHDETILKIELLVGEVQDLKDEAHQLKEVRGKALWSYMDQDHDCYKKQVIADLYKDDVQKSGLSRGQLYITHMISNEGILARQRKVALSQSLFSVLLSLVVGIVVWEAGDPCLPLVMALFVVVTMSLLSVLQLFTRIEHKPASESVALLSINSFILGALASPMLPRIACFFAPFAMSSLQRALKLLGL